MKKTKIKTYSTLYPCYLYICTEEEAPQVDNIFTLHDTIEEAIQGINDGTLPKMKGSTNAFTVVAKERNGGAIGFLVVVKPELITDDNIYDTISHESVHVADGFYEFTGATTQNLSEGNEPYAYLVGWIAGCMSNYLIEYKRNEFKGVES